MMLSVKKGDIKYQILSFWYGLTWDSTPIFWAIGEHSIMPTGQYIHVCVCVYIYIYIYIYICSPVEYTNCISVEGLDSFKCPGYYIKPSDGEALGPGALGNMEYTFIAIAPKSTLTWSGST